jgi:hypothetical protein
MRDYSELSDDELKAIVNDAKANPTAIVAIDSPDSTDSIDYSKLSTRALQMITNPPELPAGLRTAPPSMAAPRPLSQEMSDLTNEVIPKSFINSIGNLSRGLQNMLLDIPQSEAPLQRRQAQMKQELGIEQEQADAAQGKLSENYPLGSRVGQSILPLISPGTKVRDIALQSGLLSSLQYKPELMDQLLSGAQGAILGGVGAKLISPQLTRARGAQDYMTPGQQAGPTSLINSFETMGQIIPGMGNMIDRRLRESSALLPHLPSELSDVERQIIQDFSRHMDTKAETRALALLGSLIGASQFHFVPQAIAANALLTGLGTKVAQDKLVKPYLFGTGKLSKLSRKLVGAEAINQQ